MKKRVDKIQGASQTASKTIERLWQFKTYQRIKTQDLSKNVYKLKITFN